MPPNVESNEDAIVGGRMNEIVTKEQNHVKKWRGRTSISKSKGTFKKKTKNDAIELCDSEGEEDVILK